MFGSPVLQSRKRTAASGTSRACWGFSVPLHLGILSWLLCKEQGVWGCAEQATAHVWCMMGAFAQEQWCPLWLRRGASTKTPSRQVPVLSVLPVSSISIVFSQLLRSAQDVVRALTFSGACSMLASDPDPNVLQPMWRVLRHTLRLVSACEASGTFMAAWAVLIAFSCFLQASPDSSACSSDRVNVTYRSEAYWYIQTD